MFCMIFFCSLWTMVMGPISTFLSPVRLLCDSLLFQGLRCEWIIVALHKDGVGYKKIAKTLKLSCSTVFKSIQRFNRTVYTQNRPRHARPKKLSARAQRHIQRLCLGNRCMSAASIAAKVGGGGGGGGIGLSVFRPYAAHCIKLVCMAVVPEGSLF